MVIPKRLGHIVLGVEDLDRSECFYREVIGLKVTCRISDSMVFMTSGDLSHEIALFANPTSSGELDRPGRLIHFAWQLNSFEDLKKFHKLLIKKGIPISGIGDHGISIGVYFSDPDGNAIEAYYELPKNEWSEGEDIFAGKFPLGTLP